MVYAYIDFSTDVVYIKQIGYRRFHINWINM